MTQPKPFTHSAQAAAELFRQFVVTSRRSGAARTIPSLLHLQTICRKHGCSLPELDSFARVRDELPAFLLCGGDVHWLGALLIRLGIAYEAPPLPAASIALILTPGTAARTRIRFATGEREISASTLKTFLSNAITSDELVIVEQEVPSDADWRLIYVPEPWRLESARNNVRLSELLLSQRAACVIDDATPGWMLKALKDQGQRLWTATRADVEAGPPSPLLLDELSILLSEGMDTLEMALEPQWRWLAVRLVEQIEEQSRELQVSLDKYYGQRKVAEQTLEQYRRNWSGGIHNAIEEWMQSRLGGPAVGALIDGSKKCTSDTFLQALGLSGLWTKLNDLLTDRMAEFVPGLSGLATRLELHRIALGDAKARWNPRGLNAIIDQTLTDKRLLPDAGDRKKGLVESLTRKKSVEAEERRAQMQRAARVVVQIIEGAFADWSDSLMREIRAGIELQLTAALANRGLPDPDSIEAAQRGLEQVKQVMLAAPGAESNDLVQAEELLRSLSNRRWLTRRVSPLRS